jgi:hypothetical protein
MPNHGAEGTEPPTARPFPWFCPRCRRKEVFPAVIPYHAERLHEGRLIAVDIPELSVPRCAKCGELVFNYTADDQILRAVQENARTSPTDVNGTAETPDGAPPCPPAELTPASASMDDKE